MKGREGEPSHLDTPPSCEVEWAVRTEDDVRFVKARTAWLAVQSLGLGFMSVRWVKRIPEL